MRRVDPSVSVRTIGTERLTDTTRIESKLIVDGGVVEVMTQPLVARLGVITKDVKELSNEHVGGSKLDLIEYKSRGVGHSDSSDTESLYKYGSVSFVEDTGGRYTHVQRRQA